MRQIIGQLLLFLNRSCGRAVSFHGRGKVAQSQVDLGNAGSGRTCFVCVCIIS
jgi:hypothetical protein